MQIYLSCCAAYGDACCTLCMQRYAWAGCSAWNHFFAAEWQIPPPSFRPWLRGVVGVADVVLLSCGLRAQTSALLSPRGRFTCKWPAALARVPPRRRTSVSGLRHGSAGVAMVCLQDFCRSHHAAFHCTTSPQPASPTALYCSHACVKLW